MNGDAYYNEWEAYPAQWLRNLIGAGLIAPGDVDERSIKDVKADDLKKYTQCHFFAGIGGWSYALRLAKWSDERPVWTGSCPCQPFSVAGKQKAQSDDRHLWPEWLRLIREYKPATIFGEQVSGAIAHGWLDEVYKGMEAENYAFGAAILPACSVGAPHKRDRLWFVADANNPRSQGRDSKKLSERPSEWIARPSNPFLANTASAGPLPSSYGGLYCQEEGTRTRDEQPQRYGFWGIEPSVGRVANGIPTRAYKLRAYGNAIVPALAAEFITAFMECRP